MGKDYENLEVIGVNRGNNIDNGNNSKRNNKYRTL